MSALLIALPALAVALARLLVLGRFLRQAAVPVPALQGAPEVALILPVKGASPETAEALARYCQLDYPSYQLLVAVESSADPAHALALAVQARYPQRLHLVVAGLAEQGGQKIHNQLAALAAIGPGARFVAFADADSLAEPGWLTPLIAACQQARRPVASSGYRWLLPAPGSLPALIAATANAAVATLPRKRPHNLLWGGAMAFPRAVLEALPLEQKLRPTLSDDLLLSALVKAQGGYVEHLRAHLSLNTVRLGWRQLLGFGLRQHVMLWCYARRTWAGAVLALGSVLAGYVLMALALVQLPALIALFLPLEASRAALRHRFARRRWPQEPRRPFLAITLADGLLGPLVAAIHLACALAAPCVRKLRWAGVVYDLDNPHRVRVLRR